MDVEVPIYHLDTPSLKVDIRLGFEGENFVLDGYDRGASVRDLTGDGDYEYRIIVCGVDVKYLYRLFGMAPGQQQLLTEAVAAKIAGGKAYTGFREFLTAAGVAFHIWSS